MKTCGIKRKAIFHLVLFSFLFVWISKAEATPPRESVTVTHRIAIRSFIYQGDACTKLTEMKLKVFANNSKNGDQTGRFVVYTGRRGHHNEQVLEIPEPQGGATDWEVIVVRSPGTGDYATNTKPPHYINIDDKCKLLSVNWRP